MLRVKSESSGRDNIVQPLHPWPGPVLISADLKRLAPMTLASLREFLPFTSGDLWPLEDNANGLPPLNMSERQRLRAVNALGAGKGFLDRIGHQVVIPVRNCLAVGRAPGEGSCLGIMVIREIYKNICPEEGDRWLGLLQSWVESRLLMFKAALSWSEPGNIPPFMHLALDTFLKDNEGPVSIVHFIFGHQRSSVCSPSGYSPGGRHGGRPAMPLEELVDLAGRVWKDSSPEWIGGNCGECWLVLWGTDPDNLSRGMKVVQRRVKKIRPRITGIYGHSVAGAFQLDRLERDIAGLEILARKIGSGVMCSADLSAFEARLGLKNAGAFLEEAEKRLGSLSRIMAVYVNRVPDSLEDIDDGQGVIMCKSGHGALFCRKIPRNQPLPDIRAWMSGIRRHCSGSGGRMPAIGAAASWLTGVRPSTTLAAALWAFIHADMLGHGASVMHDGLTWNVIGDEILSWGDIAGAIKAYRAGIRTDGSDANLLNSLGVCLAEQRRIKEAVKVFDRALRINPDDFMSYYNLGGIFFQKNDLDHAETCLRKAFDLNPEDPRIASRLAEILVAVSPPDEAIELIDSIIDMKGSNVPRAALWRTRGNACMSLGRWQEAKKAWEKALKVSPEDAESMVMLALVYLEKEGDMTTASKLAEQAAVLGMKTRKSQAVLNSINNKLTTAEK